MQFNFEGICYCHLGDLAKSLENYNKAIKIEDRPNYYYNRAYTYKEHGKLEYSIKSFEICIQKYQQKGFENEELAEVYFEQCLVLKRQIKFQEAKKKIEEAYRLENKKEYLKEIKDIDRLIKNN